MFNNTMLTTLLTIAGSIFIAELGDKTQLLVVGFAAKYKLRDIFIGVGVATILLNALGVFLGALLSELIPINYIGLSAGLFFLIFALLSLRKDESSEECPGISHKFCYCASLGIGAAFFVAELGDKTQLSAIAFAAENSGRLVAVFLGAVLGMLLADCVGLVAGLILNKKLPERVFAFVAFLIFSIFGFTTLWRHLSALYPSYALFIILIIAGVYLVALFFMNMRKKLCK